MSRLYAFFFIAESGGHIFRDLLDDIRADPVWHYWDADQDQRAGRKDRLSRARLFDSRHRHPDRGNGVMRNRFQAQSQRENIHRPVMHGQGDCAGGPGSCHSRRGRQG